MILSLFSCHCFGTLIAKFKPYDDYLADLNRPLYSGLGGEGTFIL